VDAPAALARILAPLVQAVQRFEQAASRRWRRASVRDVLARRPVRLSDGTEGVARGVGPDGALQVARRTAGARSAAPRSACGRRLPAGGGRP
jgi:BirA family biotin operon repressor/biotin-[acetyl-CoA-carboxylase] ligase